jgi:tetratricopeptide (TPR) repeat protein
LHSLLLAGLPGAPIFSISVSYYRERRPRAEDAPALVDKAIKLSPLDPDLGRFYWIMGRAYFTQGKYDKAIENLQQSIQLRPPTWFIRAQLISAYALTQQLNKDEAQAAISEYQEKCKEWRLDPEINKYY